ncbi:hypothetical protein R1sor_025265 [Riccia sorocarpa]|uniref:Uncharacterized protein n=1 Tax=Riccia sorocarpa TaxID=122646 RepID=A0ABD3G849_9MARC
MVSQRTVICFKFFTGHAHVERKNLKCDVQSDVVQATIKPFLYDRCSFLLLKRPRDESDSVQPMRMKGGDEKERARGRSVEAPRNPKRGRPCSYWRSLLASLGSFPTLPLAAFLPAHVLPP